MIYVSSKKLIKKNYPKLSSFCSCKKSNKKTYKCRNKKMMGNFGKCFGCGMILTDKTGINNQNIGQQWILLCNNCIDKLQREMACWTRQVGEGHVSK